ncbi:ABC transporter permease subunit [Rhodovulum sp. DZ06]|uniref:ABC transporter permease subunit n=1 Tax=Rhodovulum sp. DZ06 TaxID=3425126 RepID=UPI003D34BC5A
MKRGWTLPALAAVGFALLYLPIVVMVIYSFNASKLASVWGGWSVQWYGELLRNEQILEAAFVSLQVATFSATIGTVFGTLIGYAMSRFGRFRGRLLLAGMATAPIVMPEVVTGLSLLLLFISMESILGWPAERGVLTVVIAHSTFCMAFVAVVIQARLSDMDRSVEEAAMDLGARQPFVFFDVTLPALMPALVSGWLLAFTLSLDDLVIASFVSGPGASTLPMVVFSKVRLGVTPEINALATIMIGCVGIAVGFATWAMTRKR